MGYYLCEDPSNLAPKRLCIQNLGVFSMRFDKNGTGSDGGGGGEAGPRRGGMRRRGSFRGSPWPRGGRAASCGRGATEARGRRLPTPNFLVPEDAGPGCRVKTGRRGNPGETDFLASAGVMVNKE